jgi:4-amino-4-deoxy-L-arabinose transferase-like glycosyltransferase
VFRHCLLLLAICLLTFFAGLGRGAIGDSDEAFYAESAREMIESGDWVTPHYNYEYRFQKPILFYWLAAGSYRAAGVGEAQARFPSALAGLALTLMTFFCGRRWFDGRVGLLAGAIVATSFGYFSMARTALPDLPLAFFIALATWTLIEAVYRPPRTSTAARVDAEPEADSPFAVEPRPAGMHGMATERLSFATAADGGSSGPSVSEPLPRGGLSAIFGGGPSAAAREAAGTTSAAAEAGRRSGMRTSLAGSAGMPHGDATTFAESDADAEAAAADVAAGRVSWLLLSAVAMALGFLTKGPVALALPVMVLVPLAIMSGDTRWRPSRSGWFGFTWGQLALASALFLAVALPWFVAMVQTHGLSYLNRFFVGENLERFATDRYNDPRPIWFYVPIVLGGLAPWTPFMILWLPSIWRWARRGIRERRVVLAQVEWRLILWAAVPFVFYTISIGKQPRYILPILPPLALLVSRTVLSRIQRVEDSGRRHLGLAICGTISALGLLLTAVLLYRARPLLFALSPTSGAIGTVVALIAGLSLACAAWLRRHTLMPIVLAAASTATLVALHYCVYTTADLEPVQRMATLFNAERHNDEPSGTYRAFVRNLVFYTGVKQTDLIDEAEAVAFLTQPKRVLCVVPDEALLPLERRHNLHLRRLGAVLYFNPAGVRLRTLLSPKPERDLETVWLVSNQ